MSSNSQLTIGVTAIDNAKGVLSNVDRAVTDTANNVEAQSGRMITRTSMLAQKFRENFGSIAVGVASLSAGMVSFATSFSNLDKAQLSLQTQTTALARANDQLNAKQTGADAATLKLQKSIERLNDLQTSGKASATDLAFAQEQVRINSEKLAQKQTELVTSQQTVEDYTQRVKLAQDNLNDTYSNFIANIPVQFMSFATGAASIMKILGYETNLASIKQAFASLIYKESSVSLGALTVVTHQYRLASLAAFVTSPVGIAILAISTLVLALAFNVGGLRDRLFELGDAIMAFLDLHFRPLADAIRWFIDNVAKPLGEFFGSALPADINSTNQAFAQTQVELGTGIPAAAELATSSVSNLSGGMTDFGNNAVSSVNTAIAALDKLNVALNDNIRAADELVVRVSRAAANLPPGPPHDTLGISDSISVTRPGVSVTRASYPMTPQGTAAYLDSITAGVPVRKNALGGEGIAWRPTLFMAGEAGPEHYKFTPGTRGSGSPTTINLVMPDGKVIASWLVDDITHLQNAKTRQLEHAGVRR